MAKERLTEELLERLRASARPEAYLDEGVTIDRTLSDYLYELRIEKEKRQEMKDALEGYLAVLFDYDPATVGGVMPDEAFYYMAE